MLDRQFLAVELGAIKILLHCNSPEFYETKKGWQKEGETQHHLLRT